MPYIPELGVFKLLDTVIEIKDNKKNIIRKKEEILGKIEFRNVSFKYPSRNSEIFKNLNFTIKEGTKVAFVGSSGCGKSTIISLLLRFYDVIEGEILLDGINIKYYNLQYLRKCFGVFSQ